MATATANRTAQQNRAARRAAAKGKGKRGDGGTVITVKVDGVPYTLHTADLGPLDTLAVRQAAGMSLRQVLANAQADPDIDVLAVIVWLARRHAGEPALSFADAVEELSYDTDYDVEEEGATPAEEDGDSPEA